MKTPLPPQRPRLGLGLLLTLALLSLSGCGTLETAQQKQQREHYATAQAKIAAYCKIAGEKIYKTVDNVEGVYLLKIRPEGTNFSNQFAMDDPYGNDTGGNGYIASFLREQIKPKEPMIPGAPPRNGYRYVEAIDPKDGVRYRYTGTWKDVLVHGSVLMGGDPKRQWYVNDFVMDTAPASGPAPRYGVTYDDLSTEEDRQYWIAGSSLRVIDLQTNEVLAERIGYMWDPGQGNNSGGRSPWLMAADYACPDFNRNVKGSPVRAPGANAQGRQTQEFVEKVLIPKLD